MSQWCFWSLWHFSFPTSATLETTLIQMNIYYSQLYNKSKLFSHKNIHINFHRKQAEYLFLFAVEIQAPQNTSKAVLHTEPLTSSSSTDQPKPTIKG